MIATRIVSASITNRKHHHIQSPPSDGELKTALQLRVEMTVIAASSVMGLIVPSRSGPGGRTLPFAAGEARYVDEDWAVHTATPANNGRARRQEWNA
jgi:hypothetical protein